MRKWLILIALALSILPAGAVYAEDSTENGTEVATEEYSGYKEEEKTAEYEPIENRGAVQVLFGYEFEDGSFDTWYSIPAAAVGENTILTGYEGITKGDANWTKISEERKNGYEALGIKIEDITELSCKVYDGNSYLKSATVHGKYDQLTVIQTTDAVDTFSPLSQEGVVIGEDVYALGFSSDIFDTLHYAEKSDVLRQKVDITGSDQNGNIQYSVQTSNNYAAIYNGRDELIAIIIGKNYAAIPVNNVRNTLDSEKIPYTLAEKKVDLNYEKINAAIKQVEEMEEEEDTEEYDEESLQALNDLVEEGKKLTKDKKATQEQLDKKATEIDEAFVALEESTKMSTPALVTSIIMATITITFFLIVLIRIFRHPELMGRIGTDGFFSIFKKLDDVPPPKKQPAKKPAAAPKKEQKKEKKKPAKQAKAQNTPQEPEFDGTFIAPPENRRPVIRNEMTEAPQNPQGQYQQPAQQPAQQPGQYQGQYQQQYQQPYQGYPQGQYQQPDPYQPAQLPAVYTGYGNGQKFGVGQKFQGTGGFMQIEAPANEVETSVLTTGTMAYITRKSTGQSMYLMTFPFTIGKSRTASFCLDNETVSRIHCQISCMKGEYIILDNNSKNGTYVDKHKIIPMTAVPLHDGSEIIISNEILVFRLGGA